MPMCPTKDQSVSFQEVGMSMQTGKEESSAVGMYGCIGILCARTGVCVCACVCVRAFFVVAIVVVVMLLLLFWLVFSTGRL